MSEMQQVSQQSLGMAGNQPVPVPRAEHPVPRPLGEIDVFRLAGDDAQVGEAPQAVHGGMAMAQRVGEVAVGAEAQAAGLNPGQDALGIGAGEIQGVLVAGGQVEIHQRLDHRGGMLVPEIGHHGAVLPHGPHAAREVALVLALVDGQAPQPVDDLSPRRAGLRVVGEPEILGQGVEDLRLRPRRDRRHPSPCRPCGCRPR